MADDDEYYGPEDYPNFDFAAMAIFATYVFDVSTQIGIHRLRMQSSVFWNKDKQRLTEGMKGVKRATFHSVTLSLLLIIVTAIAISLPSRNLDQRMVWIVEGLSLLFAAVVLAVLSFNVGRWTGIYFKVWEAPEQETSHSLKEVEFRVRWRYYRIFARYYFLLMPFYQGATAITIPVSMLGGIGVGLFISFGVYLTRRKKKLKPIAILLMVSILIGSCILLADGCYLVAKVWAGEEDAKYVWFSSALAIGLCVEGLFHIGRWFISRNKYEREDATGSVTSISGHRPRMAASLIMERMNKGVQGEGEDDSEKIEGLLGDNEHGVNGDSSENPGTEETTTAAVYSSTNTESVVRDSASSASHTSADLETSLVAKEDKEDKINDEEDYAVPSYKQMFCTYWTCCGCVRGNEFSWSEKAWNLLHWTVWYVLVGFSLWLVIINIGSTTQQKNAKEKLPFVQEALYDNINEGPVCAFDNKGGASNIAKFQDKEAAHAAGFLVLHCGACAACSDWHNLRLEYTTRNSLEADSAKCAKKSLFGGREAVLECLKQHPVGFQGRCAECWVDDILCTKEHCSFIYLQSLMIKTVTNFQVGAETITSASCEEAHCEAGNPGDFVYCSGATRRRMNVTSTIDRPGSQRCGIVDVDWATLFPE